MILAGLKRIFVSTGRLRLCAAVSIVCSMAAQCADCFADSALNRQVFESCGEAEFQMKSLSEQEKREFVQYLTGVLNLQTHMNITGPDGPGTAGDPRIGGGGFAAPGLFRAFDPVKDMEAKRCAVKLLVELAPFAVEALPDFLALAQLKTWPPDFTRQLEESAFRIAVLSGAFPDYQPSGQVLESLSRFIGGEQSVLAENILYELGDKSVPFLVEKLENSDPRKCDALCRFLLEMDPEGTVIGKPLIGMVRHGSPDVLIKVAGTVGKLGAVFSESLPVLIGRLGDTQGLAKQAVLLALSDVFSRPDLLKNTKIAPAAARELCRAVVSSSGRDREILLSGLSIVISGDAGLQKVVLSEASFSTTDGTVALLGALGMSEPEESIFNEVASYLKNPVMEIRLQAVLTLSSFRYRETDVFNKYLELLNTIKKGTDPVLKNRVLLAVAEAVSLSDFGTLGPRFNPWLLEMLSIREVLPAETIVVRTAAKRESRQGMPATVTVFAHAERSVTPALTKLAETADETQRVNVLSALSQVQPIDAMQVRTFIRFMGDKSTGVRSVSEAALRNAGRTAVKELEKIQRSGDPQMKVKAAQLLVESAAGSALSEKILREALQKATCRNRIEILKSLGGTRDFEGTAADAEALLFCAGREAGLDQAIVETLCSTRLSGDALNSSMNILNLPVSVQTRIMFINRLPGLGVPTEKVALALLKLLGDKDVQLRLAVIRTLGLSGPAAGAAVPALVQIAGGPDSGEKESGAAVLALSRIDPGAFDYEKWIIRRLSGDRSGEIVDIVLAMRPEAAVGLLRRALAELSGEAQFVVLRAVGELSSAAYGLVPEILPLLSGESGEKRFFAMVAVLKIDPGIPQALPALRKELVGVMSQQLIIERFPKSLAPVLEHITREPLSRLERRNAQILLDRLV